MALKQISPVLLSVEAADKAIDAADDLLPVIHARDLWKTLSVETPDHTGSVGTRLKDQGQNWNAGVAVYDISDPATPRQTR